LCRIVTKWPKYLNLHLVVFAERKLQRSEGYQTNCQKLASLLNIYKHVLTGANPEKIKGGMWLKLYENLKIFGGKMNELYKFEGVKKPTF